jgi:hypothetical protein
MSQKDSSTIMAASQKPSPAESREKVTGEGSGETSDEVMQSTDGQNDVKSPISLKRVLYITITTLALMTALLLVALDVNILGELLHSSLLLLSPHPSSPSPKPNLLVMFINSRD